MKSNIELQQSHCAYTSIADFGPSIYDIQKKIHQLLCMRSREDDVSGL